MAKGANVLCLHSTLILTHFSWLRSRQHQLRVHLEFMGFPIHNDTLYGGTQNASIGEKMKMRAIEALNKSVAKDISAPNEDDGITTEMITAAKEVCLVCQGNADKSFSAAQLLVSGHRIDLHAMVYRITFEKKQKKQGPSEERQILGTIECKIGVPDWAKSFQNEEAHFQDWLKMNS